MCFAITHYEKLITQDKVDLVLGPVTSAVTDAVADVNEKYRMPMIAPTGSAASIYRKGRKFVFGMNPPAEVSLEGLVDLAAKKGLKTVALISSEGVDRPLGRSNVELAKKKGLQVILADAYPPGTGDFSAILTKVRAANPDALFVPRSPSRRG
jgi:branched-chain amino acid transport system substrate-binding protein